MTLDDAISFIRPGIHPARGIWADIGAGTGLFSQALMHILEEGKVIALDKSPHMLYSIRPMVPIEFEVMEGDFNRPLSLPPLDGILMANALHYASDHAGVLKNVLASLRPGGTFVLMEYDTMVPNDPWVPFPVSYHHFQELCVKTGLSAPRVIGWRDSVYRDGRLYAAAAEMNQGINKA